MRVPIPPHRMTAFMSGDLIPDPREGLALGAPTRAIRRIAGNASSGHRCGRLDRSRGREHAAARSTRWWRWIVGSPPEASRGRRRAHHAGGPRGRRRASRAVLNERAPTASSTSPGTRTQGLSDLRANLASLAMTTPPGRGRACGGLPQAGRGRHVRRIQSARPAAGRDRSGWARTLYGAASTPPGWFRARSPPRRTPALAWGRLFTSTVRRRPATADPVGRARAPRRPRRRPHRRPQVRDHLHVADVARDWSRCSRRRRRRPTTSARASP